jgi:two-component system, NarL family, response regulator NreC
MAFDGRGVNLQPMSDTHHLNVLLVDDHAVVRSGLKLLLEREDDIDIVGEAGTAEEAVAASRTVEPDVVVMDVVLPDESGIRATRTIMAERPTSRVLVLSVQDDPAYVREAFAAGASGYLLKEGADTDLVQAVREVGGGGRYVHPGLGARLIVAETAEQAKVQADPLSTREREVLRLLALGHTNQEIAQLLTISVRTAETHRAHIMRKLHLQTRAELVRHALASGLLSAAA